MAQVGGMVALQEPITDGKGDFFFAGVNNVKWRRPVVPGDTLVMEMELVAFKARFGLVKMKGVAYVDGQKVVEGDFSFAMVSGARGSTAPPTPAHATPHLLLMPLWSVCTGQVSGGRIRQPPPGCRPATPHRPMEHLRWAALARPRARGCREPAGAAPAARPCLTGLAAGQAR